MSYFYRKNALRKNVYKEKRSSYILEWSKLDT